VDRDHGSALAAWEALGRPATPSPAQLAQLRQAARLPNPEVRVPDPNQAVTVQLSIPPHGLALIEARR
jgi:xylan 1,4-beta-xylosidase